MTNEENNTAVELTTEALDTVAGGAQGAAQGGSREEIIPCPYHGDVCLCITYDKPVTICCEDSCSRGMIHHICLSCGRDFYTHANDPSYFCFDSYKIVSV